MIKLYGSTTSPYARRLRIWLANKEHAFINMDIFDEEQRTLLREKNPILKIPFIEDDNNVIYDSRIIHRYLNQKWQLEKLSWQDENNMSLMDGVNDALVNLLILKRSEFNVDSDQLYFNLQHERADLIFNQLNEKVVNGEFSDWNYVGICLFSLIDWAMFRALYDFADLPNLVAYHQMHLHREEVVSTDPR